MLGLAIAPGPATLGRDGRTGLHGDRSAASGRPGPWLAESRSEWITRLDSTAANPHAASTRDAPHPVGASARALTARLIVLSLPYWRVLIVVVAFGLVLAATRYLRAWLAEPLLDRVIVPAAIEAVDLDTILPQLGQIGLIAGLTLLVAPAAVLGRTYYANWIAARVRQDVDVAVARKFLNAPLRVTRAGSSGDRLARAMADVQIACQAVTIVYKDVVLNVEMLLAGIAFMIYTSWQLTLISLVAVPPFSLLMSHLTASILNQVNRRQASQSELSSRLLSILSGIKVIKAFRGEDVEQAAFDRETGKFFRHHMKVMKSGALVKATSEAMYPTIGAIVLGIGAVLVANNQWGLSLGRLTAFALALVTIYKPIKTLTQAYPKIVESAGSAERLFAILDMDEETVDRPDARPMTGLRDSIRFEDVRFRYGSQGEATGEEVLRGIDLEVAAGEVVAIVGRTGAGKSTLVDLVLRFHDPTQGAIRIDGIDLRDLQRDSLLRHIAVVTQEPFLFDASVAENIRYGRPEASDEEVRAAAIAASAHSFIEALPAGYETMTGEFGLRLSGGQRQRITIARAILADASILVFDEATSALDAQTERAVQDAIEGLRGERTIFLVAHRLSTIERADRIVVLDEGQIAEIGDHASLLATGRIYRELIGASRAVAS